jgi:Tfp pilus assembly protein PilF
MLIIHKIDDFLYTIFPKIKKNDDSSVAGVLANYYTYGPFKPSIKIDQDYVTISIDTAAILTQEPAYKKVVALCEKAKYEEAKPVLQKLIQENPSNSEYHRIMGQILSDEGQQEDAINCLIDALRWDPKNGWALLMMGNIFAKFKDDVDTALKYFDQALLANTNDHISLTNIGYLLLQQNKLTEAKKYLWEATKINTDYPNTHFTLALIAQKEGDLHSAFYSIIEAIKSSKQKDTVYQNSVKQAFEIANQIIIINQGKKIFTEYKYKLEFDAGKEIDIVEDANISTTAKIEFAENYDRPKHLVKYKPGAKAVEHLVMHELVHLDLVTQARNEGLNQIFISNQQQKAIFIKGLDPTIKKFRKLGISEENTAKYCDSLFTGLNLQVYNAPIDLFIEDFLYNEFPELRPYQFISLYTMLQNGLEAVTSKKIIDLSPANILSKSKVYNMVNALQYRALYGLDFIKDFNATPIEGKQAEVFYDEYLQYKTDKEPAEEYELVTNWAEDLGLQNNFELLDENEYRNKRNDIDNLLASIEKDPYNVDSSNPYKDRAMGKFQKAQEEIGVNMAVVLFMQSALNYFKDMPPEKIKEIAVEIAMKGTQGFNPKGKDYEINSIPGKQFSGYQILAWYYVSWSLAMPEMVGQLGLNYEKEYEMAKAM